MSPRSPAPTGRLRPTDPSRPIFWDTAGGVGLRLDKDEW